MKVGTEAKTENSNLAVQKPSSLGTLQSALMAQIEQIKKALPKHITADRLARVVLTALRTNPKLGLCDKNSFLGAVMVSAQLGLEVNTPLGQAYLIPYNGKRGMECNFQLGYQGLLDLAYRSDKYQVISAMAVYPEDKFEYAYGLEPKLIHVPSANRDEKSEPSFFYAMYRTKSGGFDFRVWSKNDVINHAKKYSKSFDRKNNSFFAGSSWADSFEGMAKKTVLIELLKYAPKSVEMQNAISSDESKISYSSDDDMITLTPEFTTAEEVEVKEVSEVQDDSSSPASTIRVKEESELAFA